MNEIKLSILIPTKDRYSTLINVLMSIVNNLNADNYEIIVQDNTLDNSKFIGENKKLLANPHVKYFHSPEPMPISDNTELAIDNACGEFLIFIGDDDFISPDIMYFVSFLDKNGGDCLIYEPAFYWWESVSFYKENFYNKPANLWLTEHRSLKFNKLLSKDTLKKFNEKGGVSIINLPRLYHGILRRNVLENIKAKTGNYVIASCPDISLATTLALTIDEYYHVKFPVSVYGASKNSGGGWTASKTHYNKVENVGFLRKNISERWDSNIPYIWSERTIYPQSAIEVGKAFNSEQIKLNFLELYASLLTYEPYLYKVYVPTILKFQKENKISLFYSKLLLLLVKKTAGKILNTLKTSLRRRPFIVLQNVSTSDICNHLTINDIENDKQ